MRKFIKAAHGSFVLASEITEIDKAGRKQCAITTRSGDHNLIAASANNLALEIERGSGHIIPAQPGYFVIYAAPPATADGDWQTSRMPVVGWYVVENPDDKYVFDSLPVIASVNVRTENIWALLTPNGAVHMPYMGEFESVADWLVSLKAPGYEDMFLKCLSENRKRVRRWEL